MGGAPPASKMKEGTKCCGQPGVTCNKNGQILALDHSYSNLTGSLPESFFALSLLAQMFIIV